MKINFWRTFLVVCLIIPLSAVTYLGAIWFQIRLGPLYVFSQTPSLQADIMSSRLIHEDIAYINDVTENSLEVEAPFLFQPIGRTSGELTLYAIPGRNDYDYAVLTGFMFPQIVFRDRRTPSFDWRRASFNKVQLLMDVGKSKNKSTQDPLVLNEVLETMKGNPGDALTFQDDTSGCLRLFSEQLPGLHYCARISVKREREIYLAENLLSQKWFRAGERFSRWVME